MGRRMDFSRPDGEGRAGQDSTGGTDSTAPGRVEIEAALERILASKAFASAPRQQALLRHIVIETIEGRGDRLKEFSLAVDVFGRSSTFDPRLDSIVRVQASRLRSHLAEYFAGDGAAETVRIEVPAGGYVAAFTRPVPGAPAPASPKATTPRPIEDETLSEPPLEKLPQPKPKRTLPGSLAGKPWLLPLLLGAASITLALLVFVAVSNQRPAANQPTIVRPAGPSIFVAQYQLISGPDYATILRDGLQFELIDSLSRFPELSVLGIDTVYGSSTDKAQSSPFGADFILTGSVQASTSEVIVTSQLIRTSSNQVVWSRRDTAALTDAADLLKVQSTIAGDVAGQLGQPYGVIQERLKEDISENRAVSMEDYLCVLQAYDYSRHKSAEQHAAVRACLEQVTEHSPGYSPAWAKLSWMYGDEERFGFNPGPMAAQPSNAPARPRNGPLPPTPHPPWRTSILRLPCSHWAMIATHAERLVRHYASTRTTPKSSRMRARSTFCSAISSAAASWRKRPSPSTPAIRPGIMAGWPSITCSRTTLSKPCAMLRKPPRTARPCRATCSLQPCASMATRRKPTRRCNRFTPRILKRVTSATS